MIPKECKRLAEVDVPIAKAAAGQEIKSRLRIEFGGTQATPVSRCRSRSHAANVPSFNFAG